jgi:predicted RNA polymerase sigma factor
MNEPPLERAFREEWAAVVATLARRTGDLQLAEDAAQEAFAKAAVTWPRDGVPARPGAWLTVTAWRKALDQLDRDRLRDRRYAERALDLRLTGATGADFGEPGEEGSEMEDDRPRLIVTARAPGRQDREGRPVPLADQDRRRWHPGLIAEGVALLDLALARRSPGPYQLQAAIAALHARAPSFAQTDWPQIALLYGELARRAPSPVVEVNRAVAPADTGKASGASSMLQRFGRAFGIAVATAVFAANGHLGTPASFDAGFRPALAVAAGLSVLGALAALAVAGRRASVVSPTPAGSGATAPATEPAAAVGEIS